MIVDEHGQKIAQAAQPAPAQNLPSQDVFTQSLLNIEAALNDAFEKLDEQHKRQVLDEIERRRRIRMFQAPGGLKTLFPGLGMRRH